MKSPLRFCFFYIFLLVFSLSGCFRPAVPISTNPFFPIDVFYVTQQPDRPYREIEWVEISSEELLTEQQTKNTERMLYRGNDAKAKDLLLAKLVIKAQRLGADALMRVEYSYYTSVDQEGYSMRGMAIAYRGD
jgi:hypothetical protein